MNVLSPRELESRIDIKYDAYTNAKMVEFRLALDVSRRMILPALLNQMNDLGNVYSHGRTANLNCVAIQNDFRRLEELYSSIQTKMDYMNKFIVSVDNESDAYASAYACATKGVELLQSIRDDVDVSEKYVSADYWPLPSYDEMLLLI